MLRIFFERTLFSMSAPLYEALRRHQSLGRAPFHTPGHKNNPAALPAGLWRLDLTELPDTGSLYDGGGPIEQAEALASTLFGTVRTCLSAGGCTLCVQAMFRLAAPCGGKIVCARNIHRSAAGAMALLGVEPVWAMPETKALISAIAACGDAKAVYVTSPDYYGRLLDISAIAAACRGKSLPLLVDCAHGAHLMFTKPVLHPLRFGASMTADSAHKTLGVLTGGAWLNIADPSFAADAKAAMALFGSSSPSFPILASLDLCRAWLEEHADAFPVLQERVGRIRRLAFSRGIPSPAGDPTRLTLETAKAGLSGTRAAELFRAAGVEPEYADRAFVVLIATPFNTEEDFLRLERAIRDLPLGKSLPEAPDLPLFTLG